MKPDKEETKVYLEKVRENMPKTRHISTMIRAFITGGIICCIGQGITDLLKFLLKNADETEIGGLTTIIMIALTGILTGFGIYDRIGNFGGAGSIVPITGFANSVVSPAIEHRREGIVLGLCANMFSIAGPVIVFGISASVIVGVIYLFI
mgnify:FL=1